MKQKKTWVIVANGNTARLFDLPARNAPPVPLKDHVWDAPEINEYADGQGMSLSSVGASQRRMAPRTEPADRKLDVFARLINDRLGDALNRGEFERLVVAAAPALMGVLREQLDTSLKALIWIEIDKDFAHLPLEKLDQALEPHLYS